MRILHELILGVVLLLFACSTVSLQRSSEHTQQEIHLLPMDSSVLVKKLENGLTYYLKKNSKPKNRIYFRLVVNAGSVLEEENQKGLAHFVEHMAFNGTKHFPKQELVDYLESIGMRFGPDINAYTSFDETVYMLEMPTDKPDYIKTGLQILKDWATSISFDSLEIEKERGVIKEEWRLGTGADERVMKKHLPVMLKDSRYAERLPIGDTAVIDTFRHAELISFYKKWYRPDLMAVMIVGDYNLDSLKKWVENTFSDIPTPQNSVNRPSFEIPLPKDYRISVADDSEVTSTSISLYKIREREFIKTVDDYKKYLTNRILSRMFNRRLYEKLTTMPDPPVTYCNFSIRSFLRPISLSAISMGLPTEKTKEALDFVREELERARKYGFTPTEFERTKTELKKFMHQLWMEKDKQNSTRFFSDFMQHFFFHEPVLSFDDEYTIFNQIIEHISLDSINGLARKEFSPSPGVLLITLPAQEKNRLLPPEQILRFFKKPYTKEVKPYNEKIVTEPLIGSIPSRKISVVRSYDSLQKVYHLKIGKTFTFWLKPTENKKDEIIFRLFSDGGASLVPDSLYMSAIFMDAIISQSGVGKFSYMDLTRKLANKVAIVRPLITRYSEGFWGRSSRRDVETAVKLLYLYFTQPRFDSTAYSSYLTRLHSMLRNKELDPESVFSDSMTYALYGGHFRTLPLSQKRLELIRFNHLPKLYKERFQNGDCFSGVFVGNFDVDSLSQLLETYFAPLASDSCREKWKDDGIRYTHGSLEKIIYRGKEPKARIQIYYTGVLPFNEKNKIGLYILSKALQIKLREVLREDESGTYYVNVQASLDHIPAPEYNFTISFTTDPEKLDILKTQVFRIIDSIKVHGLEDQYLEKVKNIYIRTREKQLENNNFWLSYLIGVMQGDFPPDYLERSISIVKSWNTVKLKEMANKVLNNNERKIFILLPEKEKGK